MKILFAIILGIIFLICFSLILFGVSNSALATLTPVSFLLFFGYLGVEFFQLDINTPAISIKKRLKLLEHKQEELNNISTSFYKLIFLNEAISRSRALTYEVDEYLKYLMSKQDEIKSYLKPYLDFSLIDPFIDEITEAEGKHVDSL